MSREKTIVLLGAGRVATHLAERIVACGSLRLEQIYARRSEALEVLTARLGLSVPTTTALERLCPTADYYIFALSDAALPSVWAGMPKTGGIWLHTAGSVSLEAMARYHSESGVLYPLQTFSHEQTVDWAGLPLYIEGTSEEVLGEIRRLARILSPLVYEATSQQRGALHLGAVLACNFPNHLIALAQAWLERNGLPPESLMPLIRATMTKLEHLSAHEAQTGPARRRDLPTIEAHLRMMHELPALREVYGLLTESIMKTSPQEGNASTLTLK